jgi:hypothetical protein
MQQPSRGPLSDEIAGERATWLEMAADWLRMIEKVDPSASDKFHAAEKAQGTHQERSEGEH